MSWFETGNRDDVIGDGVADTARHALLGLPARRAVRDGRLPSVGEFLASLEVALGRRALAVDPGTVDPVGADGPPLRLAATFADGLRLDGTAPDPGMAGLLAEAIADVDQEYVAELGRAVRLGELLEIFAFVLAPGLERYLDDDRAVGHELAAITTAR